MTTASLSTNFLFYFTTKHMKENSLKGIFVPAWWKSEFQCSCGSFWAVLTLYCKYLIVAFRRVNLCVRMYKIEKLLMVLIPVVTIIAISFKTVFFVRLGERCLISAALIIGAYFLFTCFYGDVLYTIFVSIIAATTMLFDRFRFTRFFHFICLVAYVSYTP